MPRPLTFGNEWLHVGIDERLWIRDLFTTTPGGEMVNHLNRHPIRLGFWTPGGFAWTDDPGWSISIRREGAVGVSQIANGRLGIEASVRDCLLPAGLFVRRIVFGKGGPVKVMTSHDLRISESDVGDTAFYHPGLEAVIHFKGRQWIGFWGRGPRGGLDDYTTGIKAFDDLEGTWRDAEDGELSRNPISQGSVDSTIAVHLDRAEGSEVVWALGWGESLSGIEARAEVLGALDGEGLETLATKLEGMVANRLERDWEGRSLAGVPERWHGLFEASARQILAHTHPSGGILAALDSDILLSNRATYVYVWPRDGALVSMAADRIGLHGVSRPFFDFCARLLPEGPSTFFQKYGTDGSFGASWHPWALNGGWEQPYQGDQGPLVLHALAAHLEVTGQPLGEDVSARLVEPVARFLASERDQATGLPVPSYDLWEERRGTHTFTVAATIAGLRAACRLLGDASYDEAAREMVEAVERHLVNPETGTLCRGLDAAGKPDPAPDASLLMVPLLGALPFDHPAVAATLAWVEEELWVRSEVGGVARYPGDYYFRSSESYPGNPWVITSLWLARCLCRIPGGRERAESLIDWAAARAHATGALPEQVHPDTGEVLGVSPLVWSHAEFVQAVLDYVEC